MRTMWHFSRFTGVALVLLPFFAFPFAADPASAQLSLKERKAPKEIQLEEITIEGRVQKPNAFYILNRSNIGYEVMDLRTSFIKKLVGSVKDEPF